LAWILSVPCGSIATTSGWKESLLHLLQLAEMAIPTLAAIFLKSTPSSLPYDRLPDRAWSNGDLGRQLRVQHARSDAHRTARARFLWKCCR